jgi:hypothetical protein
VLLPLAALNSEVPSQEESICGELPATENRILIWSATTLYLSSLR